MTTIVVYCDNESSRTGLHKREEKVTTFYSLGLTFGGRLPEADSHTWEAVAPTTTEIARWMRENPDQPRVEVPGFPGVEMTPTVVSLPPDELYDRQPVVMKEVFTANGGKPIVKTNVYHDGEFPEDQRFLGGHETHVMRCAQCGLNVQRRHDAVWPILEKLRENGIDRISLSVLGAMLS